MLLSSDETENYIGFDLKTVALILVILQVNGSEPCWFMQLLGMVLN